MDELKEEEHFSKYIRIRSPDEIEISRENVFFRDKYQEIINYINVMVVNDEEELVKQYVYPKGSLLLNINWGTDITDLFEFIAKSYSINLVEFDYEEIFKDLNDFRTSFNNIIEALLLKSNQTTESDNNTNFSNKIRNLLVLEWTPEIRNDHDNLMRDFLLHHAKKPINFSFLDNNLIIVWINHNIKEIQKNRTYVFETFDLLIRIPPLTKNERTSYFTSISEKYPKIVFDISKLVQLTNRWEVKDLNRLLRLAIFKQYLNSDLNEISNEITHILEDLIEKEEFLPVLSYSMVKDHKYDKNSSKPSKYGSSEKLKSREKIILDLKNQNFSEFLLKQFYEDAASENYSELIIILDKLVKKEFLEESELKLLSKYPFILKNNPEDAQIYLEKARKRIEQIQKVFEK